VTARLSTTRLKELISAWLDRPEVRAALRDVHVHDRESQERVDRAASWFGLPSGSSTDQVRERIWRLFKDGAQWKRIGKRRLKESFDDYFAPVAGRHEFVDDFCGGSDAGLIERLAATGSFGECWHRCFVPNNDLGDNFRLEVVTTPDDTAVVGWVVILD